MTSHNINRRQLLKAAGATAFSVVLVTSKLLRPIKRNGRHAHAQSEMRRADVETKPTLAAATLGASGG